VARVVESDAPESGRRRAPPSSASHSTRAATCTSCR
jgi:hypothetical protein